MSKRMARRCAGSEFERLEPRRLLSDVIAVGPEFRVNTYTTSFQERPSVAMDPQGGFVIAWQSRNQDGSSDGVFAQRYNATGAVQGPEFRVNTYTFMPQSRAAVAMDSAGDFVVAWNSYGQDGGRWGVYAQRYNNAGVAQDAEFRVNTYITGGQLYPAVAMDSDGDFVIAWSSSGQDGSAYGVYAQRYNAAGVAQGTEFRVNSYTTDSQIHPTVAMDSEGDLVVAWLSWGQDGSAYGVYAQRYNAAGVAQGPEFQVNTYTTSSHGEPAVAMDTDGDFVIAWDGQGLDDSSGIFARRFDSSGNPQGDEFRVNTYRTGTQSYPAVAMDSAGDFVVAWTSYDQDGSARGIYAQRYNAVGTPQGSEFRVNTHTTSDDRFPAVAMDSGGDFVVTWDSNNHDGSSYGIYAQRYAVVPEVTASGFEFATAPHQLSFTFDRDVSASLGTDDLVVQKLTTMQTIPRSDFSVSYDTVTNVATFSYTGTTAGIIGMLPDGNYTATLIASGITTVQGAPLATDHVLNFHFLQGDADHDGRVNLQDFNILAANFGQSPRNFTQGDFDYDTIVNLSDFNILAAVFGHVLPSARIRSVIFALEDKSADAGDEDGFDEDLVDLGAGVE